MAPKKRKSNAIAQIDRDTFPGWVEMESEPAFFNVMLRDLGVHGVRMQELYSLDDEFLAMLPKPVHALIFLFRYRQTDQNDLGDHCPEKIWFAEQVPEFACGTFALLNIVNNIPGLQVGKELHEFKESTAGMTPHDRGNAVDSFTFMKRIHNSFANKEDLEQANAHLQEKLQKARKRQAVAKARETKAAKAAQKAKTKSPPQPPQGTRSSKRISSEKKSESSASTPMKAADSPGNTPSKPNGTKRKLSESDLSEANEPAEATEATPSKKQKLKTSDDQPASDNAKHAEATSTPDSTPSKPNGTKRKLSESEPREANEPDEAPEATPSKKQKHKTSNDKLASDEGESAKPSNSIDSTSIEPNGTKRKLPESEPSETIEPTEATTPKKLKLKATKNKPASEDADYTARASVAQQEEETQPPPRRSGRKPQPRKDPKPALQQQPSDVSSDDESAGFHFCAYLPIGDSVWKLDGMDPFPQDMGPVEDGKDWLSVAQPALMSRMMQYAAGAIEFNLMAVVHDPMIAYVEALAANAKLLVAVEEKLADLVEDWRELVEESDDEDAIRAACSDLGLSNVDIEKAEIGDTDSTSLADAEDLDQLLNLRKKTLVQQVGLRRACADEMELVQSDEEKASIRRSEYTAVAQK